MTEDRTPANARALVAETEGVQAFDLSFRLRAEVALGLLDRPRGSRLADLGCGVGAFSALVASTFDVIGVDVSEENLDVLRSRHPDIGTARADLTALPFDDATFDAAVCMEVLEHVEDDDRALREVRRILRPGGTLVVSVPNAEAPAPMVERLPIDSVHAQSGPERHFRDGYALGDLVDRLTDAGFAVDVTTTVGGAAYRGVAGLVSLAHLLYRRLRGQPSWSWADVERDSESPILRAYGRVFPLLLATARIGAVRARDGATIVVRAHAAPGDGVPTIASVHYEEQRRFFEELAGRYDSRFFRSRWPRNQVLKARLVADRLADAAAAGPVVELGCGTGQIAEIMLEAAPALEYVGLDLSEPMLAVARRRLARFGDRVDLRVVAGAELELEVGRYAAAFGIDVLHHVDDPVRLLSELRDGLAPGAPVLFCEPNPRFPLTTLLGVLQKEERNVLKIGFRNLRRWFEAADLEHVRVAYGPLYTPPGPPPLVPLLDRLDRMLSATPLVRGLAIFFVAEGRTRS